jgi:hypothetical protein
VATAGDVNGDGYADVIIGIENWGGGDIGEGGASMYYGSRNGLQDDRAWHAEVDQATAHFGSAVATAGDVNGDGYADLVVGAPSYTNVHTDEGQVFLYYGNGRPGIDMRLGQLNAQHPLVPIAPLGWTSDMHYFRVAVRTRTPYGGGWVRSEVELRPFGIPLREVNHVTGWFDSETGDGDLLFTLSGLAAGTRYHWRVRLRYDPVTAPFQQYSRWMHIPWNGWSEQDLRTAGFRSLAPVVLRSYD